MIIDVVAVVFLIFVDVSPLELEFIYEIKNMSMDLILFKPGGSFVTYMLTLQVLRQLHIVTLRRQPVTKQGLSVEMSNLEFT